MNDLIQRLRDRSQRTTVQDGNGDWHYAAKVKFADLDEAASQLESRQARPLDMLLFCPRCELQHIDAPEPEKGWTNPPHATHTCKGCGLNWRPSNGLTNGVAALLTTEPKHVERFVATDPRTHGESQQARIRTLTEALNRKQAEIDRLMLEFCPGEMTAEQRETWANHQVPASQEDSAATDKAMSQERGDE